MRAVRDCYASLTSRKREVMVLVVSGLLNKQVGAELGISVGDEIAALIHDTDVRWTLDLAGLLFLGRD
jgi:FixJ family two-component response regulator